MGPHVTPDGALGGGRLSVGDVGGWLNSYVFHAESAFAWAAISRRPYEMPFFGGCQGAVRPGYMYPA